MTTYTFVDPTYVANAISEIVVPTYVPATFSATGALATFTGASRFYVPNACTLSSVRASVGTAPTGQAILCDVNKNGSTIFGTQANRPTIAVNGNTALAGAASTTSFAAGDFITVDLDQVGSGTAGSDLTVQVFLIPSA